MIENKKKVTPKRLIADIPEEIHTAIKNAALNRNITMRIWLLRIICDELEKEKQYTN